MGDNLIRDLIPGPIHKTRSNIDPFKGLNKDTKFYITSGQTWPLQNKSESLWNFKKESKMFKLADFLMKYGWAAVIMVLLAQFAAVIGIVYLVWHFASKFW